MTITLLTFFAMIIFGIIASRTHISTYVLNTYKIKEEKQKEQEKLIEKIVEQKVEEKFKELRAQEEENKKNKRSIFKRFLG